MVAEGNLKLAGLADEPVDVLPLERRITQRRNTVGQVTAIRCGNVNNQVQNHICSLHLRDISDYGLGARCAEPVHEGAAITVFFPPHGPDRGFDVYGHVVRCQPIGDDAFELGIRLRTKAAA